MMTKEKIQKLSKMFHILGHHTKLTVLSYVMSEDDAVVPTLVAYNLGIPVAQAAYSLKRMSEVNILTRSVSGRYTFYKPDPEFLSLLMEFIE